jgi:DNA-binding transcriptional regulator YhcF (GntR family)
VHVIIAIDPRSPVPLFEQVRGQIAAAIMSGQVVPGERLPTVRQLAADLRLAVNTVARAYQELEAAGLVGAHGRHGTFVTGQSSEVHQQAERVAKDFTARMGRMGIGPREILAMVRRQLSDDSVVSVEAVTHSPAAPQ